MWNWRVTVKRLAGRRLAARALLAAGASVLPVSCGPDAGAPKQPAVALTSPLGSVPAEPQRPGSAEAGYDALVNNAYVTCGIPDSAYKRTARPVPRSQLLRGRTSRNAELPYNLTSHVTSGGVELVTPNCLTCHAGYFQDQLIVGLGNESADFTQDPRVAAELLGTAVMGEEEALEWRKWADRLAAIAPYTVTDTVGVNPAVNLTWALFAHREPRTLAWSSKPLFEPPPTKPLPGSVPPWWRMRKKHAMFYTAAGRGDHARLMMLASTLCTDTVEEARAIDAYAPDIRAFIASLEPPAYPFDIDRTLAERGRDVFARHCSVCHGTYGASPSYPNLVIGLETIGTDPELALAGTSGAEERFVRWMQSSFYGEQSRLAPAPGYVAPPLDGVWATAPYLHNGSVPTLEALLNSAARPTHWVRSFDSSDYNSRTLGWNYTELPYGKAGARDAGQRKRIYDTTLPGYSNKGHAAGDGLTDDERSAILEYLKTF